MKTMKKRLVSLLLVVVMVLSLLPTGAFAAEKPDSITSSGHYSSYEIKIENGLVTKASGVAGMGLTKEQCNFLFIMPNDAFGDKMIDGTLVEFLELDEYINRLCLYWNQGNNLVDNIIPTDENFEGNTIDRMAVGQIKNPDDKLAIGDAIPEFKITYYKMNQSTFRWDKMTGEEAHLPTSGTQSYTIIMFGSSGAVNNWVGERKAELVDGGYTSPAPPQEIEKLAFTAPVSPVIGATDDPATTGISATGATVKSATWTGRTGTWAAGDTPKLEVKFAPASGNTFKAAWAKQDVTVTGQTNYTVTGNATAVTVTITYDALSTTKVPAVETITAETDATSGGLKVAFTEPTATNADKISDYTVNVYAETDTTLATPLKTATVSKGSGATGTVFALDNVIKAGTEYQIQIVSNTTDGGFSANKSAAQKVTIGKATVTVTAGTAISVVEGYATAPTTTVKIQNDGSIAAKGITLPALGTNFASADASAHVWDTTPFDLAAGTTRTYTIELSTGKTAQSYNWEISGVTGTNLDTVASATVLAKVTEPGKVSTVNLRVPEQPKIGEPVGSSASVSAGADEGTVSAASWTGANGSTWADEETPKITLTMTAPANMRYDNVTFKPDRAGVTATGSSTDGGKTMTVTVSYSKLQAASVTATLTQPTALTYGYQDGSVATLKLQNTSQTEDAKVRLATIGGDFEAMNWPSNVVTIAKNTTQTFTVKLETGKTATTYTMSANVTAETGTKVTGDANGTISQLVNPATATLSTDKTEVVGKANTTITAYAKPMVGDKLITEDIKSSLSATPASGSVIESATIGAFEPSKGYPINIKIKSGATAASNEVLTVSMAAVSGKFTKPSDATIKVSVTDKTAVEFALSKTTSAFTGADQTVTLEGIKDSVTNANVELVEGTDYEITYDGAATKPKDAKVYTVTMVLKGNKANEYVPASTKSFEITKVAPVASLTTTTISASGKTLADYFSGLTTPSGNSYTITGSENQFKAIATDVSGVTMSGTFALTGGKNFEDAVLQGASYGWTFTPSSGAATNYKALTGTVKPWPNSGGGGVGGGGSAASEYTVTYDAGEHGKLNGAATENVEANAFPTKVPSVTAEQGWRFLGWALKGKKDLVNPAQTKIASETTFVAQYEEFTLSFDKELIGPYIEGNELGNFGPDRGITRGEVAAIMARTVNLKMDPERTYFNNQFTDITKDSWFAEYVGFLAEMGVIQGNSDGTFGGNRMITREEFVAMVMRVDGLEDGENLFPDVSESNWAYDYIIAAATKGYIDGFEDGSFRPAENINRASVVKIMNGVLDLKDITGTMKFSDVPTSHWAYSEILAASIGRTS